MKKFFVFMLCLSLCSFMFAQNITVKQNSFQKVALSIAPGTLSVEEVSVPEGDFSLVSMKDFGPSNNPGAPELPVLVKYLQIPVCESVVATVTNAQYTEYSAAELGITHPLYPNQPSMSKSAVRPPFSYDNTVYTTDEFYSLPLVSVEKIGIQRDMALANIYVAPVQYNPVTQRVRVYSKIDVEFTFVNANIAQTQQLQKYSSPMFAWDNKMLLNEMPNPAKTQPEFANSPIKYLIIANSMFSGNSDLEAFANWKRRLGYKVEIAYTSDASVGTTTTSIKSFIQNKYDNATTADPAPTFLLLIGDVAQVPAFSGTTGDSHVTDLYYATLSGSDNIPDCYYGRLSATSTTHLKNQLDKIMMYEQYTMPDPSYLGKAVLIAGTDGNGYSPTHADGQINYVYNNYINTSSTTHNYTTVYKHNYNCSGDATTIRNEINAGVGWANYTAHGSSSGWADPSFSTSHVSSMTNANKYGLLIGNCCQSGTFDNSECFGEALLRAQNKGAMGYIGASQVTYWNEDVYWAVGVRSSIVANMSYQSSNLGMYDKLFHTHNEAQSVWVSTIGGILYGGNVAVQASSSSRKLYYWEIYHCFGDPSVRVYLGMPNTMNVNADDITLGEEQYQVQAVPYAYVALKKNTTEFVAAAFANASGMATLTLPATLEPGTLELVVLAQNYIPYFQNVEVIEEGGCLSPSGFTVSNVTPFTANLSWTGENGGVYNIERKAGNGNWTSEATGITATSYTLTGLQDNTEYQVRVQSVCGTETSSWRTVTFTTPVACPVPTDLTCTAFTTTTATLAWTENGSATTWVLQYGTNSNFTSGTYTQVTVTGNPTKTLTGLTAETTYYARVKASCGGQYGQSQWSATGTFMPSAVQTFEIGDGGTTNNTFLPSYNYYNYSFSQQIYTLEEIGSAGTIKSIAFKNTGETKTRTYSVYLKQADKETFTGTSDWISVSSSNLVFTGSPTFTSGEWTKLNFTTPFEYDGESNLIVTVADNTGSYTSSPHMACLVYNATNQAIYAYNDGSAYNISSPGTATAVASVKNQIRMDIVPASGIICSKPKDLVVSDLTVTSATLSWTAVGAATNWVLQYGTNSNFTSGTYTEVTVTGTPTKSLTDLTTGTTYYARVKAVCDVENESSWSNVCTFTPSNLQTACEDFESYTGTAYNTAGTLPTGWNVIFTGSNSAYSPHVATQIYNGVISSGNGFCFTSGSSDYGSDNYAILPTYEGTLESISFDYRYESTSSGTLYLGYITNISNANTFVSLQTVPASNTQGTSVTYSLTGSSIPENARLAFKWSHTSSWYTCGVDNVCVTCQMPLTPCDAVTSIAVEAAPTSATLTITGGSGLYNIETKEGNANWVSVASNVSGQSYTLTNLNDNTSYQVRVQSICSGNVSDWTTASFSTPAACYEPTNLAVSEFNHQSAVLSWSGDADSWKVAYKLSTASQFTEVAVNTNSYIMTGLLPVTSYTVKVAAICGDETVWSDPINFTTLSLPCPAPTDVTVSNVGTNSAVLTWTEDGYATSWVVSYYSDSQVVGNPLNMTVSQPTCTLTGLAEATSYVVTVRPVCDSGEESWSEQVTFTTEETPCISIELSEENGFVWSDDFESYTSSTTSSTGVEPTCWVLVQEDVAMSQDKKPQLCYKASYAHSGNYSLKMNYRGIYAMPNLILPEEYSMNQVKMEMYLRQPNAVYQLEVGVLEEGGRFVPVALINNATTGIERVVCDFSNYTGNGHRIAFHNVLDNSVNINYSYNYIDDIELSLPVCGAITLPYSETFENITDVTTANTGVEPECWELVQEDVQMTEDKKPQLYYKSAFAHSGDYTLRLNYLGVYAMPRLSEDVPMNHVKLTMYLRQPNANYQLQVGVLENDGTFVPVNLINNTTTDLEFVVCDFSSYTGNGHRIAFRNVLGKPASYSYSYNYIDDIELTDMTEVDCGPVSLPYNETFEYFTSATSAATGVQPDCWELVQEDVQMPEEKKPQLYYKSAFANSGNYSLRMFNRCVYAMPYLDLEDGNISDLHLSMYLRQPAKAYTLEVGVWETGYDADQNVINEFVPVHVFNNSTTDLTYVECDFSSYTGDGGRIAFRNTLKGANYDYSYNYMDDISINYAVVARGAESEESVVDAIGVERYLEGIAIYPNPTTGELHIGAVDVQKVECYNQMGQLVAVYDNERDLNISNLAQGVYTLRITVPQGVTMRKVVKR